MARIVLSRNLADNVADIMGWPGAVVGQDTVIQKPAARVSDEGGGKGVSVGYHYDGTYINDNFVLPDGRGPSPGCTLWIALEDSNKEVGGLEYAVGSHLWSRDGEGGEESDFMNPGDPRAYLKRFSGGEEIEIRTPTVEAGEVGGKMSRRWPQAYTYDPCGYPKKTTGSAILHCSDVFHGSGPNTNPSSLRTAIAIHYIHPDSVWKESVSPVPWGGNSGYIYGRYRRRGDVRPCEDHFPRVDGKGRTRWVDEWLGDGEGVWDGTHS